MVDDDGIGRSKKGLYSTRDLSELHPWHFKDLLKVLVTVDVLSLVGILQLVGLR